jgi:mono/diheme cytochrome c family protein
MPAHTSNDLNDKELEDIIAYIVSIRSDPLPANQGTAAVRTTAPAPTPTPVLPKGDVTRGETYFRQMACQHCHPSMGKAAGTRGQPNLATSTEAANAAYTRYRIRFGFTDESSSIGNMPAFKNDLTDQELEDLVSYVLSINTTK